MVYHFQVLHKPIQVEVLSAGLMPGAAYQVWQTLGFIQPYLGFCWKDIEERGIEQGYVLI